MVGNDAAPEFSAKTLPPGTAPLERTFKPNATAEVPGQADNDAQLSSQDKESTYTSAESTLGGATSSDVHKGMGKPMSGQTAADVHHGERQGLAGVGASGATSTNKPADEKVDPRQRGLERESGDIAGKKTTDKTDVGAYELPSTRADNVAAERD